MKTITGRLDTDHYGEYTLDGMKVNLDEFLGQRVIVVVEPVVEAMPPGLEILEEWPDEPTRKEGSKPPVRS
jgi:hypothetical protein